MATPKTKAEQANKKASKKTQANKTKEELAPKAKSTSKKIGAQSQPAASNRGKKFKAAYAHLDAKKRYELDEALDLLPKISISKFIGSIEMHINLNIDPKQSEQNVRGNITMPHATGKNVKIAVITSKKPDTLKELGADIVGNDNLLEDIAMGKLHFDVLIATPDMMPKLAKLAKTLGPKGLMPNPKSGTVTAKPEHAIKELKAGKTEFRNDSAGIIHQTIGKLNLSNAQIKENVLKLLKAVLDAKPPGVKGSYIKSIALAPTMGPSIKLDVKSITELTQ